MKRYIKSTIASILEDNDLPYLQEVAADPNTDVNVLLELARRQDLWATLACNPNTPLELLEDFAKSDKSYVLFGLVSNPNTPLAILKMIFPTGDYYVDHALVQHPNLDSSTLIDMIKSGRLAPSNCRLAKNRLKSMQ